MKRLICIALISYYLGVLLGCPLLDAVHECLHYLPNLLHRHTSLGEHHLDDHYPLLHTFKNNPPLSGEDPLLKQPGMALLLVFFQAAHSSPALHLPNEEILLNYILLTNYPSPFLLCLSPPPEWGIV